MNAKSKPPTKTTNQRENDHIFYLAGLIDNISDALISTDMEFNILEWNAAAESIYGWGAAEVIGHPINQFVQSEYANTNRENVIQTVLEHGSWKGEVTQNRKDGSRLPVLESVSQVQDKAGNPIGFITINRDISDRKQMEETLRWNADKFSILFNGAPYAAQLAKLPDGLIVEVNAAFENLIGYSRAEAIGKSSVELNIYPDPEIRTRTVAEFKARGFVHNMETTLRAKSGDLRTVLINSDLVEIAGEKYILTTAQDITERKQAEQQIVQMKRLYATLSQVNQTIVRVKSQEELYQSICDVALKFGELTFAWIGLLDEVTGDIRPVAVSGLNVAIDKWPFPILNIHRKPSLNRVITDAMHTSNTVTSEDVQTDERTTALQDMVQKFGFHSLAAVPFRLRGKTTGVLVMISVERGVFKAPEELKLLDEMGLDISFALDTMRTEAEHRQAELLLRYSEQKYSIIFDKSPYAIALNKMPENTIVGANDAFLELFEFTRAEVLGKTSVELGIVDAESRAKVGAEFQAHGKLQDFEVVRTNKTGKRLNLTLNLDWVTIGDETYILTTIRDITARKQAEAQIEYQAYLLENVNDAIIASDAQFRLKAWNLAAEEMYGWKAEEVLGRNGVEILQTRFSKPDAEEMRRQIAESGYYFGEATQLRKDGSHFPVEVASIVLRDEDGKITDYVSVNRDITERKRAEAALRLENERFQRFVESNIVGIAIANAAGKIVTANDYYLNILGVTRQDFEDDKVDWRKFTPPEWLPADEKAIQELRELGVCEPYEKEYVRADGTRVPVYITDAMLPGPDEEIAAFVLDITERKRAEEQIQRQLKHLNALRTIDVAISSSFDMNVILDVVLQQVLLRLSVDAAAILLFNPQTQMIEYAASLGFRSNALQYTQLQLNEGYAGRTVRERKTIYIPALMEKGGKLAEVMRSAKEDFVDYYGTPLVSKDGIKGVLEIYHRSPLQPDPDWLNFLETLAGQAAIAIDNAQLFESLQLANAELERRVEQRTEELNQTNAKLEYANRAKDEFLATMSHELRTPLNSILGLSETLLEQIRDPLSAHQQRALQTIASSGEHLLALINDILDLSKIEAGKFEYHPQMISVDDLCRSSLTFVKEQATRKSIKLTYQQDTTISKIYADPRRLKQILVNLLTNAVKFTPDNGQILLQVHGDVEQGRIQFSVIDTGIGIALKDLRLLFIPFSQVDSSLTRQYEGTGLGLALVQKLTDLHGGSVDVESEGVPGKGSRFTINLPIGDVAQQGTLETVDPLLGSKPAEKIKAPGSSKLILLAEDNMANIMTIGDYLDGHGYQVVVAHDGLEAIEKAEALQPNIILMDIQMPVLNGLDTISRLRADPRFASTPIIALTALAMPGDRERCLEAGANEYITKPASLKGLVKSINKLLDKEE